MEAKQLRARRGQVYKHRLDPQTVFMMRGITEDLEKNICINPSQAVLIRRALRHYAEFVQDLTERGSVRMFEAEKQQLIAAAGRLNQMN